MTTPAHEASAHVLAQKIVVLRIELIEPHPANVRETLGDDLGDLARSIRRHGILQPLTVQPHPSRTGRYRILAGHRRFDAAQLAGLTAVPAIVRHGVTDEGALELMLVENCQRRELGAMERAEALGALVNRGYTQQQIAERTGKSQSWVGYYLALLDLDSAAQEKVRAGELAVTHAISAVRQTRKRTRKKAGSTADFSWEPDHLTETHQLAKAAAKYCQARGHTMRRRIGDVACGACWETAIRLDERKVIEAEEEA
ncbi:ParB/RepB/Spo0J family partition protein [Actinomadura luteofluorescens]|uniref:ParB/RepB/Spo0J family partition protein n=1 Tax=Actinomadura luteofluorescens TaxID=46163 RepID=UPI00346A1294